MALKDYLVEEFEHCDYTIKIYADADAQNPREFYDHAAEMVSLNSRDFTLDREATGTETDAAERGTLRRWYAMQRAYTLLFRIDDYGSSGWSLHETDDANGFLLLTSERIQSEGIPDPEACLEAELTEFRQYLEGDVYGYVIEDSKGEHVDSCWGFYGIEHCRTQAKEIAEHCKEQSYWKGMHTTHAS